MNKRLIIIFISFVILLLSGCNKNVQESSFSNNSTTPSITDNTEEADIIEDNDSSIKYKTAAVYTLIDVLNIYYKDKLLQPFENIMVVAPPFKKIVHDYEYCSMNNDGVTKSVNKFIQGIIEEENNIVNISIIEDNTFDNGGYIFSNTNNFSFDYFDSYNNDNYTISVYKYKKCYIIFEFYNMSMEPMDKKAFIAEFAELLEENYSERDKLVYNEDDDNYITKLYPSSYFEDLQDGFNAYYKNNITSYFQRYTKSEIPLFEITDRYTLDEISEEDNSILAVTKYLQGSIEDNSIKISFIEDKTFDNNGFIFTTEQADSNPMIYIYRYNNIYIILEFYNAEISNDFMNDLSLVITNVSKMIISLLD
jgi:hypothetical protein